MKRLLNAAVALAATLVAYQAYVLAIVPIVEPTVALREFDEASEEDWQGGAHAVGRWQEILRHYVPADHWALAGTPQVYEYDPMVLVLDDFRPVEGGRIELTKCLLLAFPTPRQAGKAPPRDAIIVEAPPRATIQFDQLDGALDFTRGGIGKPVAGKFPGELVIRSDMNEPGPQDDLRIVTRDLWFDLSRIATGAPVDLRLGPHRAHGRQLEIRLLKEQHASRSKMPIAGVASLEVREQVRATIEVGDLPIGRPEPRVVQTSAYGVRQAAAEAPLAGDGPLEVTSAGPFFFDFTNFEAKLQDDVRATLRRAVGPPDQLFCRELRVQLGDDSGVIDPRDEPDLARRQSGAISDLQPRRLEAIGSPVRLESPSRQAAVRGERLRVWIPERRLQVEGGPAQLAYGLSEAQAPMLQYTAPPEGSNRAVGELLAAGPGWMRLTPSARRPERTYEARWKGESGGPPVVKLGRDDRGQPLLRFTERPEFAAAGFGKLRADEVAVRFREVPPDGDAGPAIEVGGDDQLALLPRRIDATGSIDFIGREVIGSADELTALVRPIALSQADQPAAGPALGAPVGFAPPREATPSDRRFRLDTRAIQLDIGLEGKHAKPLAVIASGGVTLKEEARSDGKEPLSIEGAELRADRLDRRGAARLTIAGGGAGPTDQRTGLARISAQGLSVFVDDLHVDQAAGKAWTDGRGNARVLLPQRPGRDALSGEATLKWRGGMDFNGDRLMVRDEVFAETREGWLRCQSLAAKLTRPIDLAGSFGGGEVDVSEIECGGGVTIDYRSTDDTGQRSHERAEGETLSYNRLTGQIAGRGVGSIRSVRLAGSGANPFGGSSSGGLRFLQVNYHNGLAGNLNDRVLGFRGRVESIYGPVLAWDHALQFGAPQGVPPDAVELECEELVVNEDPAAAVARGATVRGEFGPIELHARGGVQIEATIGDEGGALIAEAATASYSQAADRFVLAGDAQQLARLSARPDATQPFVPATAGRLTHYLKLGRTKIEDLRGAEYTPPPASANRPGSRLR